MDKRLEIRSKSEAGDRALQKHLDDQKKASFADRAKFSANFKQDVSKDPFVITIRPRAIIRQLPLSIFVELITSVLEENGAKDKKDFEVIVHE